MVSPWETFVNTLFLVSRGLRPAAPPPPRPSPGPALRVTSTLACSAPGSHASSAGQAPPVDSLVQLEGRIPLDLCQGCGERVWSGSRAGTQRRGILPAFTTGFR